MLLQLLLLLFARAAIAGAEVSLSENNPPVLKIKSFILKLVLPGLLVSPN